MKKREMTKATLDELARIMPILTEKEMEECIGRAWYYNQQGTLINKTDTGNSIYVQENGDTLLLSQASNYAKRNIIGVLAQEIMGYSGQIGLLSSGSEYAVLDEYGRLSLADDAETLDNYYDLRSILCHEGSHFDDYNTSGYLVTGDSAEIKACQTQVASIDYSYTSYSHKIQVARNWYNATGQDVSQKQTIANACGVNISDI